MKAPRLELHMRVNGRAVALEIEPRASFLVGDRLSDVEAGRAAGVGRCFLVRTGYGLSREALERADGVYEDLLACVRDVLNEARPGSSRGPPDRS